MYLFQFSNEEMLTFFAVLVRYSVLFALIPFVGDRFVPAPVKVLLALSVTMVAFPQLVHTGVVNVEAAKAWGASVSGITTTLGLEALFGLTLAFVARLTFDAIVFGANLSGHFMGFAAASSYDPHQETQTQVVAEVQLALAMMLFLAIDGHHLLIRSTIDSYGTVGIGAFQVTKSFAQVLIKMTADVITFGVQIAAPVAVSLFAVNVAFGVMSKAMPQLNVLVLSFAVTALVGLLVLGLGLPEFQAGVKEIYVRGFEWLEAAKRTIGQGV